MQLLSTGAALVFFIALLGSRFTTLAVVGERFKQEKETAGVSDHRAEEQCRV